MTMSLDFYIFYRAVVESVPVDDDKIALYLKEVGNVMLKRNRLDDKATIKAVKVGKNEDGRIAFELGVKVRHEDYYRIIGDVFENNYLECLNAINVMMRRIK